MSALDLTVSGEGINLHPRKNEKRNITSAFGEDQQAILINKETPYQQFFLKKDIDSFKIEEESISSPYEYLFKEEKIEENNISLYNINVVNEKEQNALIITYEKKKERINFTINSFLQSNSLYEFLEERKEEATRVVTARKEEATRVVIARKEEGMRERAEKWRKKEKDEEKEEEDPGEAETQPKEGGGGENYLAQGGATLVRRISASINNARARQTHEGQPNYELHRSFFLIIWEHFAPNPNIGERPRQKDTTPLNARLPPMYSRYGNRVCSVLLRCVKRGNNIAYSVLFEFTQYIHWSIFYSFDINHMGAPIDGNGQVSELHFTLNPYGAIPKTRMFFEYTHYINGLISLVHDPMDLNAQQTGSIRVSSKQEQGNIMEIVSELMLLTMYQLVTAVSYVSGGILSSDALNMRQNIDKLGRHLHDNQLLNIALRHVDLIECIQQEFRRHSRVNFATDGFINHLKTDISRAITAVATTAAPAGAAAGPAARPGGGKNINRYLTKINNIKEKLKLLKKNKVKNKVKITKLSKSIDELKAKLKKQKEKEKAKLKKQKEKEKAKLKKQKEKEKAKLKKQKEKEKAKRKKTKA